MDKVFTCFDFNYFNLYGISWIASIRTLGQYSGPICAITFDQFPPALLDKLAKENIQLISAFDRPKARESALDFLQSHIKKESFAYWDSDGYFMNSITDLPISDKLLYVKDTCGFVAGSGDAFGLCAEYNKLNDFCGFKRDLDVHKYFPSLVDFLGTEWNYCHANRSIPANTKFIHFSHEIKKLTATKENLSFAARYPEIYKEWAARFHISTTKKLFRKVRND